MRKIEDQSKDAHLSKGTIELDVLTIMEQLGIDLSKWPSDLPPLQRNK
ncbi:hypothetical protein [Paenibacillus sp. CF384]|nr:hypothetical protein [Paenibacillus sp. CF384]SDX65481.1 hypothetical protein SAMN05518855_101817 [Paenibacillus sp. CF384]